MYLLTPGMQELRLQLMKFAAAINRINLEEVSVECLCSDEFMEEYTQCADFGEFMEAVNLKAAVDAETEGIPAEKLDECVKSLTEFDNWDTMIRAAARAYFFDQLFADKETKQEPNIVNADIGMS